MFAGLSVLATVIKLKASVLLAFVVATLVLVVGGYFAYHIYKFAKRVNGPQDAPQPTNESMAFPPTGDTNITFGGWVNPRLWFEWTNMSFNSSGSIVGSMNGESISFSLLSTNDAVSNQVARPVVYATLNEQGNVITAVLWEKDTVLKPVSFRDLGMSVDEAGVPDMSWSVGQSPTNAGILVGLERSTNLVDWVHLTDWWVSYGITNIFRDGYNASSKGFYRSVPR